VVATENGGIPCGSCRQVMAEFGTETEVIIVNTAGKIVLKNPALPNSLPGAFTKDQLL